MQQKGSGPHSCNIELLTLSECQASLIGRAGLVLSSEESQGHLVTQFFLCISRCKRDLKSSSEVSGLKLPAYPFKLNFIMSPVLGEGTQCQLLFCF